MMNPEKWINTLPNSKKFSDEEKYKLNPDKWVDTLPKKNTISLLSKYTVISLLFLVGLISVSIIKNETRDLQKEIKNLQASIDVLKMNLHKATLDHEVITSPENLSRLAKGNLELELNYYKKSQIKDFNKREDSSHLKNEKISQNQIKDLSSEVKIIITKKIDEKKSELKKLQEIYKKPEKLPDEIRSQVAKKIKDTKHDIKRLYTDPEGSIDSVKMQRWAAIQVVKAFLGIPIIPGK